MPKKPRVLVADDDPQLCDLLSAFLRERGWDVDVARDGMQAVMFTTRHLPDVVLLDVNMPGGTGVDALQRIRRSTKTALVPVVVMSGNTDAHMPFTMRSHGATEYVAKPLDLDALHALLTRIVSATASRGRKKQR